MFTIDILTGNDYDISDSAYGFKKFDNKIYFYEKSNQGDILYQTNIETSEKLNISK